jgi:pimeloyl-ACP methyl ester carboxylesterase
MGRPFSNQFPEWAERLVLVVSGGLGKEISPLLKAVTLPGAEYVLPLLLHPRILEAAEWPGAAARRVSWRPGDTLSEVWRSYTTLTDRHAQMALVNTLRSVIDVAGQRASGPAVQRFSAHDRLNLAAAVPSFIVWGDHDRIFPWLMSTVPLRPSPAPDSRYSKGPGTSYPGGTPTGF